MNVTDVIGNGTEAVKAPVQSCDFTTFEFVGYFYVLTIVCLIGIVLNVINIVVFAQKCFSATVYVYMSAISLTDAITLLAILPTGLVRCVSSFSDLFLIKLQNVTIRKRDLPIWLC